MIRLLGILIGLGFVAVAGWSLGWGVTAYLSEPRDETVEHRFHEAPRDVDFSFDGPFGKYDRAQLQRGFQVYKEVCASCHSLSFVAFRNLEDLGYVEEEVKAIADQWQIQVPAVDPKTGEASTRKPLPADKFPDPYPNEVAARAANNNALPPDLSLIAKARHGGPAYVASLLTGYRNPPADLPRDSRPGPGLHYNPVFPNLNIAMPPPLRDGQVSYADGTDPSIDRMATDVSAFLAWTAEPKLENRRRTGWAVLIFLVFAALPSWFAYKKASASLKHSPRNPAPPAPKKETRP